ncbi:MBL fold metallo-hydrolase [Candidatus Jorgensenbacteria bacterium]|nr:MBL fold metallo-hydrolase [Candidatus Jorgensenbacteria bacterium]
MVITYHGDNYFKLVSGETTILIDPVNLRSLRGANLVISTLHPPLTEIKSGTEENPSLPFYLSHQGEYEIKGIHVRGWSAGYDAKEKSEQTVYRITVDDLSIACLGFLKREPAPNVIGELKGTDIVIVPASGKPFLSEAQIAKISRQIEPSIIIPSLTDEPKTFLKEMGVTKKEPDEKLVVKKKDLKPGSLTVVWLKS